MTELGEGTEQGGWCWGTELAHRAGRAKLALDEDAACARGEMYELGCVAGSGHNCRINTLSDQGFSTFNFALRRAKKCLMRECRSIAALC